MVESDCMRISGSSVARANMVFANLAELSEAKDLLRPCNDSVLSQVKSVLFHLKTIAIVGRSSF